MPSSKQEHEKLNKYTDKNGQVHIICRLCKQEEETQSHILESCQKLKDKIPPITKDMIFDEDTEKLRNTAKMIEETMEIMQNT